MRSAAVITSVLMLFSASVNAISVAGHGSDLKALHNSHSSSHLDEDEVRILDGWLMGDELGMPIDDVELLIGGTTPNPDKILEKRRGGGRGGGGGGRSGRSRTSGGGSTRTGGSLSNTGGRTTTGSGTTRSYGGYYGGGAAVPYTSGNPSTSGMLPVLLSLSLVSVFFTGAWLYSSIYAYNFEQDISYHNATSDKNETLPVTCLCQEYSVCGCDENHNQTYIDALVANATGKANDTNEVRSKIAEVNGTRTLVINGTLDNGTTADGGTEAISAALKNSLSQSLGLFTLMAVVAGGVFFN